MMHHAEHRFSNFGCFSIFDAVVAKIGDGCSVDVVLAVAMLARTNMHNLRGSCSTYVVFTMAMSAIVRMQNLHSS